MQSMRSLVQVLCFFTVVLARAGEFKNLTFDDPVLINLQPEFVNGRLLTYGLTSRVLQGWEVKYDGAPAKNVYYGINTGGDGVSLIKYDPPLKIGPDSLVLGIWGAISKPTGAPQSIQISVSQKATLPSDVVGINYISTDRGFQLLANGVVISNEGSYADLSKFSGSEVNLELRFPAGYRGDFDIIGFTIVPEPSEITMLGLGLSIIGWQAWKRRGGRGSTHAPSTSADPV